MCIVALAVSIPQAVTADEPTNQELLDLLNELDDELDNITAQIDQMNNNTTDNMQYLNESINDINFTGVNNLGTDLEIISHELADIQERLGYPMTEPNATVYDDLTLILEGLTYESGGSVQWLLKNDTGYPYIQVLGQNQEVIAEYQVNQTETLTNEIQESESDVKSKMGTEISAALGSIGTNFWLLVVLLIIALFLLAWKFFLQSMFAQQASSSGRPMQMMGDNGRPNFDGSGRPACFGDPNKFDPGNDPDCVSCPWVQKCQTALLRDMPEEGGQPMTTMKPKYDYAGNIVAILDDGQPIQLPGCFGREFDPNNQDCQECAINSFCAQQQQKNQQIQVPPQPQSRSRQQPMGRRGSNPQPQGTAQAGSGILNEF